jgi:uncharacterized protein (DUF2267 family)
MSDDPSHYIYPLVRMRFDLKKKPMTSEYQTQIEEHEKKLSAFSLPELEAEYQRAELVKLRFGKPEYALSESELVEKGHFEERLSKLSPSELVRYASASEDETVKNLVEAHRFRALTPELRVSYFGEPPEYLHWGALDCWTIDEATSLTMGLDPKVDLFSKMKDAREVLAASGSSSRVEQARHALKVKRDELWKEISVRGFPSDPLLQLDEDPEEVLREWTFADAADEYIQLQDRIKRAIDASKIGEKIIPAGYMLWAIDSSIAVPDELKQTVEARNEITDWKARRDDLLKQRDAIAAQRDDLERELSELKSKLAQGKIKPTERTSVRRLIIGMAVGWYGYNPNTKRNEAIREIFDVLKKLGIPRDMDTVRNWLQESAEELPPDWEQGNRS